MKLRTKQNFVPLVRLKMDEVARAGENIIEIIFYILRLSLSPKNIFQLEVSHHFLFSLTQFEKENSKEMRKNISEWFSELAEVVPVPT